MRDRRFSGRLAALLSACAVLVGVPPAVHSAPLGEVVRGALQTYPSIVAAQADRQGAQFDIERARALHYPTVDLQTTRRISGLATDLLQPHMRLNLWASGGIEAQVERESWRERALASRELVTRDDVAFGAAAAWFRLLRAMRVLEALGKSLDRHARLTDDFTEISRIDTGRRADLVQAQSRLEQVRFAIANQEAEMATARATLARYYPGRIDEAALVVPELTPEPPELGTPDAITMHPAVQTARRSLFSAEAQVKAARAERMPRVDIDTYAGKNSASLLTVSFPAFDLGRAAAEKAAETGVVSARASVEEQQRLVEERQRAALQDLKTAERRRTVSERQIRIAQDLVENYRAQFQIGRRNLLDLLNGFAELSAAEQSYEAARVDGALARAQIDYALGRFAARYESREDAPR